MFLLSPRVSRLHSHVPACSLACPFTFRPSPSRPVFPSASVIVLCSLISRFVRLLALRFEGFGRSCSLQVNRMYVNWLLVCLRTSTCLAFLSFLHFCVFQGSPSRYLRPLDANSESPASGPTAVYRHRTSIDSSSFRRVAPFLG
jgi:hypothetical protein